MIHGNNFKEISELRAIEDTLMDAIARVDQILTRKASLEEMKLLWQVINEKQRKFAGRVNEHRAAVDRCLELLAALEEREDMLQIECFQLLEKDAEDAGVAKSYLVEANRAHEGWWRRNLQLLKAAFSKKARVNKG